MDRQTYTNSIMSIISDHSKFTEIFDSISVFSTKIEDKINNFLRKLKNSNKISDEIYKKLYVTGSGPGILYGSPKIHKPNFSQTFPLRPIFAAYNTASYKLSKFIVPILAPFTTGEFTVQNSYKFADEIQRFPNANNYFMTSFDIENLFTNVPLLETINICLNYLFPCCDTTILGFDRNSFKSLLEHSVLNSFFLFNSRLFRQIDGVGMGLPLGPSFANVFMCFYEKIWLHDCPYDFKPILYRRYVDDTFLLFRDPSHVNLFLQYVNNKHPNIKFTCENEINGTISFLDIKISRLDNKFTTSVYRKSSFTGLGMNFFSFCTPQFKINSIRTLIFRAFNICSNFQNIHNEFEFLKSFFKCNGFPINLVCSHIKKFLAKQYSSISSNTDPTSPKFFISLPYFGPYSERMKLELHKLLNKYFIDISPRIILVNKFTISSFFKYKDTLPLMSRSSVIYKYVCSQCEAEYVGVTSRALHMRVAEHRGRSFRTNNILANPSHSSIRAHCEGTCNTPVSSSGFSILDSAPDFVSLCILESLHIFKLNPSINDTNSSFPLYIVK